MEKGIITGCDQNQEWLLKWWWSHYHSTNFLPVTFFDFGMSREARKFCEEKGTVVDLTKLIDLELKSIHEKDKSDFELMYGKDRVWNSRKAWFSKPFAALNSPYNLSLWLDLDCEIKKNLNELFEVLNSDEEVAMKPEADWIQFFSHLTQQSHIDELIYNSGVVLFRKNSEIIKDWAKISLENHELFAGDQEALSRVIYLKNKQVKQLAEIYNASCESNSETPPYIVHYAGDDGKAAIKQKIQQEEAGFIPTSS